MYFSSPLSQYLEEIGRIPLLTADEEISLGHTVREMVRLKEIPEADRTPAQKKAIKRGMRAKRRMIEANLRLVVTVAKKRDFCTHLSLMDLIQEGSVGLDRAVEKFDPARGYKFSTYAYWWIRQGISRATANYEDAIRLPGASRDAMRKIYSFIDDYQLEHGRYPSRAECAAIGGVTVEALAHYMKHQRGVASLDATMEEKNGSSGRTSGLANVVFEEDIDPEARMDRQLRVAQLEQALHILNPKQREVIIDAYGLETGEPKSLQAIAQRTGCSRESVRTIKERAFKKLKIYLSQRSVID